MDTIDIYDSTDLEIRKIFKNIGHNAVIMYAKLSKFNIEHS